MYNFVSFIGMFVLMGFAWSLSADQKIVNWKAVFWGTTVQLVFALFIFKIPAGIRFFSYLNIAVDKILDSATAGTKFLFGTLALPPGSKDSLGFILAFQALPTIVFFASLMAFLYYVGVMPLLIKIFSRFFSKFMNISGAEAMSTASNIFVGVESAMTVRPYLRKMTNSELCTIIAAGMGTIASSVMAFYVIILREKFPAIAGHLIAASFLGAPASILMSKLILPETEKPETLGMEIDPHYDKESSVIEAVIVGANDGLKLVFGIVALLLAFLGMMSLADIVLGWGGNGVNGLIGVNIDWSLKGLLGLLFYPFTLIIGVPVEDAFEISKLIGERAIATEVAAYQDLSILLASGKLVHPERSALVAVYALCGFAHIASLAIFVGGTAALVPERTKDLAKIGPRALIAATLACLMMACVAGIFYTDGAATILFGAH